MNKSIFVLFLFLPLLSVPLAAQEIPPPKAPYWKIPPSGSRWSAEVTSGQNPAAKKAGEDGPTSTKAGVSGDGPVVSVPVRIECRYGTNQILKIDTSFSDGRADEAYIWKNQMFRKYDNSSKVAAIPAPDFFPDSFWISKGSDYVGTEAVDQIPCYKFKIKESLLRELLWPPESQYFAWIRVDDGYPLRIQADATTYTYSPISRFPETVELPPTFKVAMERVVSETNALEAMQRMNKR